MNKSIKILWPIYSLYGVYNGYKTYKFQLNADSYYFKSLNKSEKETRHFQSFILSIFITSMYIIPVTIPITLLYESNKLYYTFYDKNK